jgi:hypothetical protein
VTVVAVVYFVVLFVMPWILAIGLDYGPLASTAVVLGIPVAAGLLGGLCLVGWVKIGARLDRWRAR